MAADDPNEKSLFTRIKNCVLMELKRTNVEVKRSPCRERSIWGSKNDKNYTGPEDSGLEKREQDKLKEKRSSEENDDAKNKTAGDQDVSREARSAGASEDGKLGKNHSRGVEGDDSKTRSEAEKEKSSHQQESCDSKKFKPVRYYIKMQNPEAPVCCESLKPRKICPPKTRKPQQQARDSYRSRPTCRCGACSSDSGENPWRNEE